MNRMLKITEDAIKAKIAESIKSNPYITNVELASKIGCSERTIYRYKKLFDGTVKEKSPLSKEQKLVKKMNRLGYTVSKNNDIIYIK